MNNLCGPYLDSTANLQLPECEASVLLVRLLTPFYDAVLIIVMAHLSAGILSIKLKVSLKVVIYLKNTEIIKLNLFILYFSNTVRLVTLYAFTKS